ncbi:hypothetical protein RJ641_012145 [Dillenia turbinata]|uniref:NAD(P)H dehydrogenase subunit CRR3, chloroplastic n=1 Tax=Dillenia turbinata TaxID=194707 RepID=A0AAN8UR41_9MAGN
MKRLWITKKLLNSTAMAMACISRVSIFASSNPTNPPPPPQSQPQHSLRRTNITAPSTPNPQRRGRRRREQQQQQQQPSIAEIERAIGVRDSEPKKSIMDTVLSKTIGRKEGSMEKQLRETGEWLLDRSENASRSFGKSVLIFLFSWVLPTWILLVLIASGAIKLPFSAPFLDDMIM